MHIDRCVKLENKYITKYIYIEKTVYIYAHQIRQYIHAH